MKRRFLVSLLAGLFAVVAMALAAPPGTVTYRSKKGTVTFKHKEHQARADRCTKCHHTSKADGSEATRCSTCHQKDDSQKDGKKVPSLKKSVHKTCTSCHKAQRKGPAKCKECHIKQ